MTKQKSSILIILDIDETMVYATKEQLDIKHDFKLEEYFVYKRPFLNEFINYVSSNFDFAVWSSATDNYVSEMTKQLQIKEFAKFCWGRSKVTYKRPETIDSDGFLNVDSLDHQFFIKRLKKVKKIGFELEKILIIDDSPYKLKDNYGNAIYVTEFKGDQNDNELLELITYLETFKDCENVRNIEKRNWKNAK